MKIIGRNISMIRGDSETITVSFQELNGLNLPLTIGDKIYFTVKENTLTTRIALQKIITSFTDGKAIIEIFPEDTKSLRFKTYVYDIQLTAKDLSVTTIIPPSKFIIEEEVTYE